MRRALVCLIAGACGGGKGAALEITASTSTVTVELFFGNTHVEPDTGSCANDSFDSCLVVPPKPGDLLASGQYEVGKGWVGMAAESTRGTATDGMYRFSLEPDAETYIPGLLFVGYDANEMPTGYTLLHDLTIDRSPEVLQIKLGPAQWIEPRLVDVDRIQVWRRPSDSDRTQSACAVVEKADRSVEWFVPADDTDCDGALPEDASAPECGPSDFKYCGHVPADLLGASCASQHGTSCRFAGPECVDAGPMCGTGATCLPTAQIACLPPQVCTRIAATGCSTFDDTSGTSSPICVPRALNDASYATSAPSLSCTFHMMAPGMPCGGMWPSIPPLNLGVLTQGQACVRLEVATFGPFQTGMDTIVNRPLSAGVELVPGPTNCAATLEMKYSGQILTFEGGALLGIITPDNHRRYVGMSIDYGTGCTNALVSNCTWKLPPSPYQYPCD